MDSLPVKQEISRQVIGGYRPEIDGLRAFAVIAVIINHFNKGLLPGGYFGVDIFFVISGYVITSSLIGRPTRNLREFIGGFYERRIKRLMPALSAFVLPTAIIICFFNPSPQQALETGVASLFGVSNIVLQQKATDYFAASTELNPFTHTWSLGVEEQFYAIFPFIIWFSGYGKNTKNGVRNAVIAIGCLTIASLVAFLYLYRADQSAAYFLVPSRFWEMSTGCLLFVGAQKRVSIVQHIEKAPPFVVVALIIGAMYLPPSFAAASTVAVVALASLLIACLRKGTLAYKILAYPKVISIGLISYSLYLWHWGVLSVSRWTIGIHWWSAPFQLLAILGLALLSYNLVEKPVRSIRPASQANKKRQALFIVTVNLLVAAGIFFSSIYKPFKRYASARLYMLANPSASMRLNSGGFFVLKLDGNDDNPLGGEDVKIKSCSPYESQPNYQKGSPQVCLRSIQQHQGRKIVFIGDSHSWMHSLGVARQFSAHKIYVVTVGGGCAYLPRELSSQITMIDGKNCYRDYVSGVDSMLRNLGTVLKSGDSVVYGIRWDSHRREIESRTSLFGEFLARATQQVTRNGAKMIILSDAPDLGDPFLCIKAWYRSTPLQNCSSNYEEEVDKQSTYFIISSDIAKSSRRAKFVNILEALCSNRVCSTGRNGNLIYFDKGHVTTNAAAELTSPLIADAMQEPSP